jgi:hypothetical protein
MKNPMRQQLLHPCPIPSIVVENFEDVAKET